MQVEFTKTNKISGDFVNCRANLFMMQEMVRDAATGISAQHQRF